MLMCLYAHVYAYGSQRMCLRAHACVYACVCMHVCRCALSQPFWHNLRAHCSIIVARRRSLMAVVPAITDRDLCVVTAAHSPQQAVNIQVPVSKLAAKVPQVKKSGDINTDKDRSMQRDAFIECIKLLGRIP